VSRDFSQQKNEISGGVVETLGGKHPPQGVWRNHWDIENSFFVYKLRTTLDYVRNTINNDTWGFATLWLLDADNYLQRNDL